MVKRQSPRILAAAAAAVLVVGLSACGRPQTLVPYTPAEGVNADAYSIGAAANHNEVPLKVRTLSIITKDGSGFLNGAITAPTTRDDELVSVKGRAMTSDNTPGAALAEVTPNLALPKGRMVVLSQESPITLASADLKPGLVAELTLTFKGSEPQTLLVPVVDATKPDYATVTPGPAATSEPAAPAAEPTPAATATPQ